jgi:CDP-diacylglycerol--glycerol-3-phosphate 3-phosphatidyltransferase
LVIFVAASLTDLLDGYLARKNNLVTNFGKFMDPLADKLLVCSALICLMSIDRVPAWMVLVIIAREFIISGFRLVASDAGVVIAASYWGKFKTISQIVMIIALLIEFPYAFVFSWIAVILTIVSLVDYMAKNLNVIKKGGM